MTKITSKITQKGISRVMNALGFKGVANAIKRATTVEEVKRQVDYVMNREMTTGRGGEYLIDINTREKIANPNRNKWLKLKKGLDISINLLDKPEGTRVKRNWEED